MPTIRPVRRALVPTDTAAAERVSAPNYDEFQSDLEIHRAIVERPENILRITMAHCAVARPEEILRQDSPEALELARENFVALRESELAREVDDVLYVYEIVDPHRVGIRQIGLGGMAATAEIRTGDRPEAPVIRNEGIREEKAVGRARLVERIGAFIGTVNLVVDDDARKLQGALQALADSTPESYRATDERGCTHRVWLVSDPAQGEALRARIAEEPRAYVADGNHRSAAAAMLGLEGYLAVFFPAATMGLAPYNRLVEGPRIPLAELVPMLEESFEVEALPGVELFQPATTHEIGLYAEGAWHRLKPKPGSFDAASAVETVDADIVQRRLFDDVLGISDARDGRLTFVGGNRDALYLRERVDAGDFAYAVTLPPVTMEQFIAVCRQGALMPPKSTWFQPKLRMGLVMAVLE